LSEEETRVVSSISERDIVHLTKRLIDIPSVNPPGNEEPIARFIAEHLSKDGLDVDLEEVLPGRPNALTSIKGKSNRKRLVFKRRIVAEDCERDMIGSCARRNQANRRRGRPSKGDLLGRTKEGAYPISDPKRAVQKAFEDRA
jgi:hypothetical protein